MAPRDHRCIVVQKNSDAGAVVEASVAVDVQVASDALSTDTTPLGGAPLDGAPLDAPPDRVSPPTDQPTPDVAIDGAMDAASPTDAPLTADAADASDASSTGDGGAVGDATFMGWGSEMESWIRTYQVGGTIDFDHDGRTDVTITLASDGTQTIVVPGARGPRVRATVRSAVEYDETADDNADGTMDITRHGSIEAGVPVQVEVSDANFDGTPDHRVTSRPHATTVEDWIVPATGGARQWVVTHSFQRQGDFHAGAVPPCPPDPPVPRMPDPPTSAYPCSALGCSHRCFLRDRIALDAAAEFGVSTVPDAAVRILTRGAPTFACTVDQKRTLELALLSVGADLERLRAINPDRHNQILTKLSRVRLYFGCGIPSCVPGSTIAWTEAPRHEVYTDPTIATIMIRGGAGGPLVLPNPTIRNAATREIIEHELFHLVEGHEEDSNGNEARDHIYACPRYQVQWAAGLTFYLGTVAQASSARDAALCASMDHKAAFGVASANLRTSDGYFEITPGTRMDVPLCSVSSRDSPTAMATCSVETFITDCDQTPVPAAMRSLAQRHEVACTLGCPPTEPYQPVSCSTSVTIHNTYDRTGGTCSRVGSALH